MCVYSNVHWSSREMLFFFFLLHFFLCAEGLDVLVVSKT